MSRLALVVEDMAMLREMIVGDLERAGWEVVEADTFELAEHFLANRGPIGLVITDNDMPPKVGLLPRAHAGQVVDLVDGACPVIVHSGDDLSELEGPNVRVVQKASGVDLGALANELVPRGVTS